jgi:hypothetical protein
MVLVVCGDTDNGRWPLLVLSPTNSAEPLFTTLYTHKVLVGDNTNKGGEL